MKILMLASAPGSIDGFRVTTYQAEQEYDLSQTAGARALAAAFVQAGFAEEIRAGGARAVDEVPVSAAAAPDPAVADVEAHAEVAAASKPGRKPKAQ